MAHSEALAFCKSARAASTVLQIPTCSWGYTVALYMADYLRLCTDIYYFLLGT